MEAERGGRRTCNLCTFSELEAARPATSRACPFQSPHLPSRPHPLTRMRTASHSRAAVEQAVYETSVRRRLRNRLLWLCLVIFASSCLLLIIALAGPKFG